MIQNERIFFEYKHVDLFKPNLKEAKEALNIITAGADISLLQNIHTELHNILQHQISLITLSEKGMFYQQQNNSAVIPSHLRNIADVSGAGDTVIAIAALTYAATKKRKPDSRNSQYCRWISLRRSGNCCY